MSLIKVYIIYIIRRYAYMMTLFVSKICIVKNTPLFYKIKFCFCMDAQMDAQNENT